MADWRRTVHCIGDMHAGGIKRPRVTAMLDDANALSTPAAHLQIGDATERGLPEEDVLALRWLERLPGPAHTILGNHDVMHNVRTPKQWAQTYGVPSPNFLIDLPFVRIICLAPDRDLRPSARGRSQGLTRLARPTAEERRPRLLDRLTLAPSQDGHGRHEAELHLHDEALLRRPDRDIRAVLAKHRNAKVWLSGHTHSPLNAPGLIMRAPLPNRRSIVSVNLSAIVGVGNKREPSDPIRSLYLTHLPGRFEIRFRDHGARKWITVNGRRVQTVKV